MTWPIDVFYASYNDAVRMLNEERGQRDNKAKLREKASELKERAKARAGIVSPWWV